MTLLGKSLVGASLGAGSLVAGASFVGGVSMVGESLARGVSRVNSATNSTASSLRKSSPRQLSIGMWVKCERVAVVGLICILLLFWALVKIFVFFVRMGLMHGLRGRHIR
jgi:hypothetical protein